MDIGLPDKPSDLIPTARQFTQVGNAVPPVLAAVIATEIGKTYFQAYPHWGYRSAMEERLPWNG